jgi:hypothetical protein
LPIIINVEHLAAAAVVSLLQANTTLPIEGAADLLQLALNCNSTTAAATAVCHMPATAALAARVMPELLEPDVTRRLLDTAAVGQHTAAVEHIGRLQYMKQHVDAVMLEKMLLWNLKHAACLRVLTQLPAAAQLSSEAVTRLLQVAALP